MTDLNNKFLQLARDKKEKVKPLYSRDKNYFDDDYSWLEPEAIDLNSAGNSLWDNLLSREGLVGIKKGFASGATFGASEFYDPLTFDWESASEAERTGYIFGEFAMMLPFMGLGMVGKGASALLKGGAKGAAKEALKKTVTDKDILTAGALKQAKNIAKATGKQTDEVIKDIVPNLREKIYKDLQKRGEGWTRLGSFNRHLYNQAAKGDMKTKSNIMIRDRVKDSINMRLSEQGIKLGARQVDDIANRFAKEVGKGVKFNDVATMFATRFGRNTDPGKWKRYFGMVGNMTGVATAHELIRNAITSKARPNEEFSLSSALVGGLTMGAVFPAVQRIPNMFFGGTGYRNLVEGLGIAVRRLNKPAYEKILKRAGEKPLRGLLKMQARGGLYDLRSSSRLGDSFWKVGKKTYQGAYDIMRQADTMPINDVISLLTQFNKHVGKATVSKWGREYLKDFAGLGTKPINLTTGVYFNVGKPLLNINKLDSNYLSKWKDQTLSNEEGQRLVDEYDGLQRDRKSELLDARRMIQTYRSLGFSNKDIENALSQKGMKKVSKELLARLVDLEDNMYSSTKIPDSLYIEIYDNFGKDRMFVDALNLKTIKADRGKIDDTEK